MDVPDSPAPWAVALANTISEEHWSALRDPGKVASEERKTAARIIQALVEEGAKKFNKPRNAKRGPKPHGKINQTDDDIASLWSCLRMILELPSKTNLPSISSKVGSVLYHALEFTNKNLILTQEESNIASFHLTSLSRMYHDSDMLEECTRLPKAIGDLNPPANLKCWASANSHQKEAKRLNTSQSRRTQQLDAIFVNLVRLMDLHKAPLLHDKRVTIHEDPRDDEWRHLEFHEFSSLADLRLKKKDILWTVIGRLAHLKTILNPANFAWSPIDPEHLINEIEVANSSFGRSRGKSENSPHRTSLNALKRVIVSASNRQGASPFSSLLPSFFDKSFPSPASPGQIIMG